MVSWKPPDRHLLQARDRAPRPCCSLLQGDSSYLPEEQKAWLKDASNAVKRHGFYLCKAIVRAATAAACGVGGVATAAVVLGCLHQSGLIRWQRLHIGSPENRLGKA
jgi:hypothetical protein